MRRRLVCICLIRLPFVVLSLAALGLTTPGLRAQSYVLDQDQPPSSFVPQSKLRMAQGFRLANATACRTKAGDRFEMVWVGDTLTPWHAHHELSNSDLTKLDGKYTTQGFRLTCVDSYGDYPNEKYVAIWVKNSGTAWTFKHRLTGAQYQSESKTQASNGYRPICVGASGAGNSTRYCGIWIKSSASVLTVFEINSSTLANVLSGWGKQGARVISVATSGTATAPRFSAIADLPNRSTEWFWTSTLTEIRNLTPRLLRLGYRPETVAAYDTTGGTRYFSGWSLESSSKKWAITGTAVPELSSFDSAMQQFMSKYGMSQGALAVVQGQKLVLARGYTYAAPTYPLTQPDSLFRLGSIAKTFTAVGVMQLVEAKKLGLDQKLGTLMNLSGWTDTRVKDITVRHLLHHWGGWDQHLSGFKPLFRDKTISTALNRPLPTNPQMIIDYMKTWKMYHAPGTKYAYANFGYLLLGRIIETVSGMSYEDYILRNVLLPVGASAIRLTGSLRGNQIPGEVDYDAWNMVDSVMGPSSPAKVQMAYGGFNLETAGSAGAFVGSAVDTARFVLAFDNASQSPLLSKSTIDEMWKRPPWDKSTNPSYYGAGWAVNQVGNGRINVGHRGSIWGTVATMNLNADGVHWVALFNKYVVDWTRLDSLMSQARSKVTTWPSHDLFNVYTSMNATGIGCGGSAGIPYVRPFAGSLAKIGFPFTLEVTSLPVAANLPVFLYFGSSNKSWGSVPLPLDLSYIGMPGCYMNVSPTQVLSVVANGGRAALQARVPDASSLIGSTLWTQPVAPEPKVNALGAIAGPGAGFQVGRR